MNLAVVGCPMFAGRLLAGSVPRAVAADAARTIPEMAKIHPKSEMFGVLPACGFFIRHARDVRFKDVRLDLTGDDARPAIVALDAPEMAVVGLKTDPRMQSPPAVVSGPPEK